jgi:hypothetical protein
VQRTGHYAWAFIIVAGFCVAGSLCFGAIVPRVETVTWRDEVKLPG